MAPDEQQDVNAAAGRLSPSAEAIARALREAGKGRPPVHLWNPDFCGRIDMRIARDGTWFHEGTPIGRPELVRLFSSILRREGDRYFLVTPVEKMEIEVDDVPFIAVDFEREGQGADQRLIFLTNVGDAVVAGPDHPIRVKTDPGSGAPVPYVHVRDGLEARIDRKSFYRLVEIGESASVDGEEWFGVRSDGTFFPFIRAADLAG